MMGQWTRINRRSLPSSVFIVPNACRHSIDNDVMDDFSEFLWPIPITPMTKNKIGLYCLPRHDPQRGGETN